MNYLAAIELKGSVSVRPVWGSNHLNGPAVDLGPTDGGLHALLANILLSTHKATEAVAEAEREPDAEWRETALLFALDAAGRKSDADRAIAAYELKHAADDPGGIAAFYAC